MLIRSLVVLGVISAIVPRGQCQQSMPSNTTGTPRDVDVIYVLGLGGWSGPFPDGETSKFVVDLALEHINAQRDILPDYRLKIIWTDSKGQPGFGSFQMVQAFSRPPTKVMIMGAATSPVSQATAHFSCFYNLTQVSYESVSPALSDKKRYPNFFRIYAPETIVNPLRLALIKHYGWTKVANVHQADELFTMTTDQMIPILAENNISLVAAEVVNDNPALQMANLKKQDVRIIIGGFHQVSAPLAFCEAYKNGLYGPKIVWIMTGWYVEDWWSLHADTHDCTRDQMLETVQGMLYTGVVTENPNLDQVGVSGYTGRQIDQILAERANGKEYFSLFYRFFYYDTIWAIALALNASTSATTKRLTEFTYADGDMGRVFKDSMSKVKYVGSLGYTEFDQYGDPTATVEILMQQGERRHRVGLYTFDDSGRPELVLVKGGIPWAGGRVPSDSTQVVKELVFMAPGVYICYSIVGALGLLVSLLFLAFNIGARNKRVVKMSSPNLNNVILLGSVVMILTVFFYEQSSKYTRSFCSIRNFTLTLGFSLVFGALFSKTWRVHVIFASKTAQNVVIRDSKLMVMVVAVVVVNTVVLVVWEVADPYQVVLFNTEQKSIVTTTEDILVQYQVPVCVSTHSTYFTGALYLVQGLLLVFGAFLAWETRKVKVEALNDSHLIGTCIYNVVILSSLSVVLSFVLDDHSHLLSSLVSAFLLIATLMTEAIIFLPKVVAVLQGQADVVPKNATSANTSSSTA